MNKLLRNKLFKDNLIRNKKKGKIAPSKFIVNIYKEKEDPVLKPDHEYPLWLFHLVKNQGVNHKDKFRSWM